MSKLVISDLTFLTELDSREIKIAGGASAGAAAAADYNDATAAGASTTDGDVSARGEGGSDDYYYGSRGPISTVDTYPRRYYY